MSLNGEKFKWRAFVCVFSFFYAVWVLTKQTFHPVPLPVWQACFYCCPIRRWNVGSPEHTLLPCSHCMAIPHLLHISTPTTTTIKKLSSSISVLQRQSNTG